MSQTELESRYRVSGMDCPSCAAKIDAAVKGIKGVEEVSVSVAAGSLKVGHAVGFSEERLMRRVRKLGYGIEHLPEGPGQGGAESPSAAINAVCRAVANPMVTTGTATITAMTPPRQRLRFMGARRIPHRVRAGHGGAHRRCGWRPAAGSPCSPLTRSARSGRRPKAPALVAALAVGLVPVARRAFMAARFGSALLHRDADDCGSRGRRRARRGVGSRHRRPALPRGRDAGGRRRRARPKGHRGARGAGPEDRAVGTGGRRAGSSGGHPAAGRCRAGQARRPAIGRRRGQRRCEFRRRVPPSPERACRRTRPWGTGCSRGR